MKKLDTLRAFIGNVKFKGVSRQDVENLGRFKNVITDVYLINSFTTVKSTQNLKEAIGLVKKAIYEAEPKVLTSDERVKFLISLQKNTDKGVFKKSRETLRKPFQSIASKSIVIGEEEKRSVRIATLTFEDVFGQEGLNAFEEVKAFFKGHEEMFEELRTAYKSEPFVSTQKFIDHSGYVVGEISKEGMKRIINFINEIVEYEADPVEKESLTDYIQNRIDDVRDSYLIYNTPFYVKLAEFADEVTN